jgi:PTS system mannose-specific IID component
VSALGRYDVWRVFWRSLFLQAGFNPEGMQTLGLLFALEPALKALYPDAALRKKAIERHLKPFNSHPYVAAGIVGGILFHEERVARGEEPPEQVERFKSALMGPLAALGDGFFWLSLRPAMSALAVVLVPWLGAWTVPLFLVLYNTVAISARAALFLEGLNQGDAMLGRLQRARLPELGRPLRVVAAFGAGMAGAWLATRFAAEASGTVVTWWAPVCLALGGVATLLFKRGVSVYVLLYGTAALAMAVGALH